MTSNHDLYQITVAQGCQPGAYAAKFVGLEPVEENPDLNYGPAMRWIFEIVDGDNAGGRVSRITVKKPTAKNACGKIVAGMLGRQLNFGEGFDLTKLLGKTYLIVVQATESGATRVESVSPLPKGGSASVIRNSRDEALDPTNFMSDLSKAGF